MEWHSVPQLAAAGDQPAIYLDQPGLHVVDVRFSVPVGRLGATGQMTMPLGGVSSGRLLFKLPAKDLDVQISGCPGGWRRQTLDSGDSISIPLGIANELSIRWQPSCGTGRTTGQRSQALLMKKSRSTASPFPQQVPVSG